MFLVDLVLLLGSFVNVFGWFGATFGQLCGCFWLIWYYFWAALLMFLVDLVLLLSSFVNVFDWFGATFGQLCACFWLIWCYF